MKKGILNQRIRPAEGFEFENIRSDVKRCCDH